MRSLHSTLTLGKAEVETAVFYIQVISLLNLLRFVSRRILYFAFKYPVHNTTVGETVVNLDPVVGLLLMASILCLSPATTTYTSLCALTMTRGHLIFINMYYIINNVINRWIK